MKAIVAVDLNWAIGCKGNLLERIPEDMRFFKQMTLGKVVVMGRKTFESLPGKEPLKDRVNIILSKSGDFENDKIIVCPSLDELFCELKKYNSDDIFIIGGEAVYTLLLPYCSEAYVTKIDNEYPADKYFPNLDEMGEWEQVSISEAKEYNNIRYSFLKYVNKSPKVL
ncbi:MAG TPA: dihydrofolate reductase [Acetivibrio sp.]|uniref:dihydrofolate reductase n=1 Tax=Acetivibrio sp. TaxID=1872092 RepID=UPI002BC0E3C7|nr:dihydrofolate reductase [Acetivibrio sp.]HOM01663.1 dihydrofolate reductase [Acetivibrio sp.]